MSYHAELQLPPVDRSGHAPVLVNQIMPLDTAEAGAEALRGPSSAFTLVASEIAKLVSRQVVRNGIFSVSVSSQPAISGTSLEYRKVFVEVVKST